MMSVPLFLGGNQCSNALHEALNESQAASSDSQERLAGGLGGGYEEVWDVAGEMIHQADMLDPV